MKISKAIYQGLGWGGSGIIIKVFLQIGFMSVMARLLSPSDFGVMALVGLSLKFFQYFAHSGVAPSLIQKESVNNEDVSTSLFLTIVMATVLYSILFVFSPSISNYFEVELISRLLRLVGLNLYLMSFTGICVALLQRRYKFKVVATSELISYAFGYGVVGVVFALNGAGVWSLAYAQLGQTTIMLLLAYAELKFPIKIKFYSSNARELISYGAGFTIIGFLEYLVSIFVPTIIGKFIGTTASGNYDRGFLIAHLPIQQPNNLINSIFFPILSSHRNSQEKYHLYFKASVLLLGLYTITYSVFLQLYGEFIVYLLLGEKWVGVVAILKLLAFTIVPAYITSSLMVMFNSSKNLGARLSVALTSIIIYLAGIIYIYPNFQITNLLYLVIFVEITRISLTFWYVVYLYSVSFKYVLVMLTTICVYYFVLRLQIGLFDINLVSGKAGYWLLLSFLKYGFVVITSLIFTVPLIRKLNIHISNEVVGDNKLLKLIRWVV